jgi:hypothetical protein
MQLFKVIFRTDSRRHEHRIIQIRGSHVLGKLNIGILEVVQGEEAASGLVLQ